MIPIKYKPRKNINRYCKKELSFFLFDVLNVVVKSKDVVLIIVLLKIHILCMRHNQEDVF